MLSLILHARSNRGHRLVLDVVAALKVFHKWLSLPFVVVFPACAALKNLVDRCKADRGSLL